MQPPTDRTATQLLIAWERCEPLTPAELAYLISIEPGVAIAQALDDAEEAAHQAFLAL